MQSSIEKLANSFRDWQRDWDRYDKEHANKPKSFDEFIQPFVEMHKQEIIDAFDKDPTILGDDGRFRKKSAEQYYQETFKK